MSDPIRLLLAEDHRVVGGALQLLLDLEPDLRVVARVERGDEVLDTARRTRPDVAVLDVDLPGCDGLAAAAALHRDVPTCRTLVLTGLPQPAHFLRAVRIGVGGYLSKDSTADDLVDAVRRVAGGAQVLDRELVSAARAAGATPLTPRETDVLAAAARGGSTSEIAATVHLSPATVRNYLSRIITKTRARNRTDALRIAREAGWLPPDRPDTSWPIR